MHDVYEPATNSWTSAPPLPTARSGVAYTLYRNLILVLGGELPRNTFAENKAYDPKTKSWRILAPCLPAGTAPPRLTPADMSISPPDR